MSYPARIASLPERRLTLSDGRTLAYWTEGDANDVPVLAFSGACFGKNVWVQKHVRSTLELQPDSGPTPHQPAH